MKSGTRPFAVRAIEAFTISPSLMQLRTAPVRFPRNSPTSTSSQKSAKNNFMCLAPLRLPSTHHTLPGPSETSQHMLLTQVSGLPAGNPELPCTAGIPLRNGPTGTLNYLLCFLNTSHSVYGTESYLQPLRLWKVTIVNISLSFPSTTFSLYNFLHLAHTLGY